ncbi:OmpH family outer membrane protein [Taibaiella chishuiensis]|uniref:Periplasmic chaperone for outer membrane proteins Skp n=1 Tax=Taibaiella chishuiensis TaxID=1434707 RepID=A0A2P8CWG0_9BACT|nr:OmpH family outer membrane protein [Taibaiella chishuiensis]PSK89277.1 periplasmic chaperone for outer membrane proteins Skp [Taibaiella chishuiensis]
MKSSSSIFNYLFVSGLAASMLFASCKDNKASTTAPAATPAANAPATAPSGKIAYVNLDTLGDRYEYFKTKKADFEKRQAGMEAEVERLAQNLQSEYAAFQKKAQAGTLTQAEGEAAQKKLAGMQQNVESRRQSLGGQLMKEQEEFNKELQDRLDNYLVKYNANKGYDFILSYVKGGNILLANKALDITEDVIKGMNEEEKSNPTPSIAPTTKK